MEVTHKKGLSYPYEDLFNWSNGAINTGFSRFTHYHFTMPHSQYTFARKK